ncbi:GIY-YIG nuclease family protein [Streptomyces drozdowiczii]|uniref:GIY-YIG nuclease family protein n=1 Tax=Streptomyces drozdowiczii TaxID=202862 RepID=UPI00403D54AC
MPKHPGRTALYRLFNAAGQLLYVGISHKPDVRWGQHSENKPWWPAVDRRVVEWHDTRSAAEKAELVAISQEQPLHNKVGTPALTISGTTGKTPTRPIRVDLGMWAEFGAATQAMGTDRSAALRAFMAWYVNRPSAPLPVRPFDSAQPDSGGSK